MFAVVPRSGTRLDQSAGLDNPATELYAGHEEASAASLAQSVSVVPDIGNTAISGNLQA